MWFGHYVENKLMETDDQTHEAVHTIEELLGAKPQSEMDDVRQLISMFGLVDKR